MLIVHNHSKVIMKLTKWAVSSGLKIADLNISCHLHPFPSANLKLRSRSLCGTKSEWLAKEHSKEFSSRASYENGDHQPRKNIVGTCAKESETRASPALSGIRILDMTRVLAGPYCTMLLADLGAEVIKVERPGYGDDTRTWGPPFIGSESCYFMCVNRNKKSVTVDMKKPEGIELIKKMAAVSDVLVENYIPGKLSKQGLGYPELSKLFPRLIYCSITGYGQTGSYASRAGYDVIVSGTGGLMHITGPAGGEPCKVGVAITDLSTGLYAVSAILASLLARQTTGHGQHIDCNLLSTNVASLVNIASNYLNAGLEAQRYGTAHPSIVPYQAFETADGYFLVGAGNDTQFALLVKLLGHPELSENPRFLTNKDRVVNREELLKLLRSVFKQKPVHHWLGTFEESGIPHGPINNMEQVFSDPQVQHNGLIQRIPHPTLGEVKVVGPAVRYSATSTVPLTAPPLLGQHTDEVLTQLLGYSRSQVASLKQAKVV
ncbi:succinate--hydroxymethylglutarate coa-transferase-like [Plakobranchus ocellatus]|uniref:Succinate--hydroxymethylglutarate coa-transferase-like n=1 Tax=Plakobranchus ocellatus TaxID=259542 RepID=A0AAV4D9J9_9GAST|nr:succinate--hydroxymethylglutarate coa-transferase-like [Plakobranchus ocellatus]